MGTAERRARQKENARQAILDAARDLFVREGYESVSVRKIADKAEYAPGTLYLYFRDKAEILDSLCDETFIKLHQRMEAIHKDAGDPLEGLRRGLLTYVRFGLDNPEHYTVTFILKGPNVRHTGKERAGDVCFSKLRGVVQKCIDLGKIASNDADETAQALWAGVHGVTSLLIMQCDFPFVEQTRLIERVVNVLIEGVRQR